MSHNIDAYSHIPMSAIHNDDVVRKKCMKFLKKPNKSKYTVNTSGYIRKKKSRKTSLHVRVHRGCVWDKSLKT